MNIKIGVLTLGFLISTPGLVHAADDKESCVSQYEQGQVSRAAGRFDSARDAFSSCTRDACPAPVRKRCTAFLEELDTAQSSIVIVVRDSAGHDIVGGISMTIDGGSPRDVPATALRLDPGAHRLRVMHGNDAPVEQAIIVRESEKDRRVDVVVNADAAPSAPLVVAPRAAAAKQSEPATPFAESSTSRSTHSFSTAAKIWMGVSIVSLVGAGTTSAIGWGIHLHLTSTCSPYCSDDQVSALRVLWPVSFVALGVGVVSGVVATVLVLTNHSPDPNRVGLYASPSGAGLRF